MSFIHPQDHFCCYNNKKGREAGLEILKVPKGHMVERDLADTEIVFNISGTFTLSYAKIVEDIIPRGKVMLFPPGSHIKAVFTEDVHLIICRIKGIIQLCECISLEQMFAENEDIREEFLMLNINEGIERYITSFVDCVDEGIKCSYFLETKMKELFFLLRAYYPKRELARFFSPLLSNDSQFMNMIYRNFRNVKSVYELAGLSLYSESGFKKQFNRVFGTSASEWLRNQKASLVYHDLNCTSISIKELADKYDFSSVSSFSTFCQNNFGLPPGKIRSKTLRKQPPCKK